MSDNLADTNSFHLINNQFDSIHNPGINFSNFPRRPPPAPVYHPARNNNYDMSKTVSSIVDNLEADLARHVKRRPSGQFESCSHPLLAAALMEDKKHQAKLQNNESKNLRNYLYKKKHSNESNKLSNSPSISPSYSNSISRSPSPMEQRYSSNKTNSRSPSPIFKSNVEYGKYRKLPPVPSGNQKPSFQDDLKIRSNSNLKKTNEQQNHHFKLPLVNDKTFKNQYNFGYKNVEYKHENENSPIYEDDDSDQNEIWF